MIEAERRTDGQHPLAYLERIRLAQLDRGQVLAFDLEQRHVGARIGADQLGFQLAAVGKAHDDLVGVGHHMVVGQHIAIIGDDEPRAQRLRLALPAAWATRHLRDIAFEELAKHWRQPFEIRHLPLDRHFALRQLLSGTDIHHGRRSILHQLGELGEFRLRQGYLPQQQQGTKAGKRGFQATHGHQLHPLGRQDKFAPARGA